MGARPTLWGGTWPRRRSAEGQLVLYTLSSQRPPITGSPRRQGLNRRRSLACDVRRGLSRRVASGIATIGRHALARQRADRHEQPDAADALLRHHADFPLDMLAGRRPVGAKYGRQVSLAAQQLMGLDAVLASNDVFVTHLQGNLTSTSLPYRDLAWRLLQLAA